MVEHTTATTIGGFALSQERCNNAEYIRRNQGRFDSSAADLPKRQTELANQEEDLLTALRDLGPGWDEERLGAFDTSVPVRAALEDWRRRLSEQEQVVREAQSNVERADQDQKDTSELTDEAREEAESAEQPASDATELGRRRRALRNTRSRLDDYRLARQRGEDLERQFHQTASALGNGQEQAPAWRNLWVPLGGLGFLSIVLGFVFGGDTATFGVVMGLALLAGAAYIYVNRQGGTPQSIAVTTASLRKQLEEAKQNESEARRALEEAASPIYEGLPGRDKLNEIEIVLDRTSNAIDRWDKLHHRVETAIKEEERRRRRADAAREADKKTGKAIQALQSEWVVWLSEREIEERDLTPPTVAEIFSRVEKAQLQLSALVNMRHRVRAIKADIEDYRARVAPLAEKHNILLSGDPTLAIALAAEKLSNRLECVFQRRRAGRSEPSEAGKRSHRKSNTRAEIP